MVINNSNEYSVLSPLSPPSESSNLRVGWGTPDTDFRLQHQLLKVSTQLTWSQGVHTAAWQCSRAARECWEELMGDVYESSLKTPNHYPNKCTVILLLFFFHNPFQSLPCQTLLCTHRTSVIYPSGSIRSLLKSWTRQIFTSPGGWTYKSDMMGFNVDRNSSPSLHFSHCS